VCRVFEFQVQLCVLKFFGMNIIMVCLTVCECECGVGIGIACLSVRFKRGNVIESRDV
jgi:hypothetical protein